MHNIVQHINQSVTNHSIKSIFAVEQNKKTCSATSSKDNKKYLLGRQLTLMCCRDLCPFNIVERSGFKHFLLLRGVIKNEDQLPCRQTLSRGALNYVYDSLLQNVNNLIQKSSKTIGMTMDMWTDNYRRRSYITFTLRFCADDFKLHDLTLRTSLFESTHTGEHIKRETA